MSEKIVERVWEHAKEASGTEMVVLLALAHLSNEDGICWPGVHRLASMARVSIRSVQTALRSLKDKGYLLISAKVVRKYRTHAYLVRCGLSEAELAACMTPVFAEDAAQVQAANATTLFGRVVGNAFGTMGEESCTHREEKAPRWVNPASPISDQRVKNPAPISGEGCTMGEESCTHRDNAAPRWVQPASPISGENDAMGEASFTHVDKNSAMGEESCTLFISSIGESLNPEESIITIRAPAEENEAADRREALLEAGIRGKKLEDLCSRRWLSGRLIRREAELKRRENTNFKTALLISSLEQLSAADAAVLERLIEAETVEARSNIGEEAERNAGIGNDWVRKFQARIKEVIERFGIPARLAEIIAGRDYLTDEVILAAQAELRGREGEDYTPEHLAHQLIRSGTGGTNTRPAEQVEISAHL